MTPVQTSTIRHALLALRLALLWATVSNASDEDRDKELLQTTAACGVAEQLRKLPAAVDAPLLEAERAADRAAKAWNESDRDAKRAEKAAAAAGTAEAQGTAKRARDAAEDAYTASVHAEGEKIKAQQEASKLKDFHEEYESPFNKLLEGTAENGKNSTIKDVAKNCGVASDVTPDSLKATAAALNEQYSQEFMREYGQKATQAAESLTELQGAASEGKKAADDAEEARRLAKEAADEIAPEAEPSDSDGNGGFFGTTALPLLLLTLKLAY
ncbi:Putative cell surface-expressed gene family [Trypanosoma congolense IL3000]|uniref:Putative cell surface-expressed gene family n=1 Tax=Trypanosoma congolense (strain IL3000) TaxID=1068625 RepID=F9WA18_TRYCI|nr:Putative cell surface-expressed gene family [Trypanosoma congolense IL3000]